MKNKMNKLIKNYTGFINESEIKEFNNFNEIFDNLPVKTVWVVKDPGKWKDWKKSGVIQCDRDISVVGDDKVTGMSIRDIEPYHDADFYVDFEENNSWLHDVDGGFFAFPNMKSAQKFFNELEEEY